MIGLNCKYKASTPLTEQSIKLRGQTPGHCVDNYRLLLISDPDHLGLVISDGVRWIRTEISDGVRFIRMPNMVFFYIIIFVLISVI